jgi:hypothetical protein
MTLREATSLTLSRRAGKEAADASRNLSDGRNLFPLPRGGGGLGKGRSS